MRRSTPMLLLIPVLVASVLAQPASDRAGYLWKGGVVYTDADTWFPLYVRLWEDGRQLHALLDAPSENQYCLEVRAVSIDGDAFTLERVTSAGERVELKGTFDGPTLTGDFLREGRKQGIFQLARSSERVPPGEACSSARTTEHTRPANGDARDAWQRMPDIMAQMGLKEGGAVAEVGAGFGWVSSRLARAVGPSGTVYAVDIDDDALRRLHDVVRREKLDQMKVVHGQPDDPQLPEATLDAVLMVNAYHEMDAHDTILRHVRQALKADGRLVIVDNEPAASRRRNRAAQTSHHRLSIDIARADLERAGFEIIRAEDAFVTLPRNWGANVQWMLVAQPAR